MDHKGAYCIYRYSTAADWCNYANAASSLSSLGDLLPRMVSNTPLSLVGVVYRPSGPCLILLNKEVSVYVLTISVLTLSSQGQVQFSTLSLRRGTTARQLASRGDVQTHLILLTLNNWYQGFLWTFLQGI